MSDVLRVSKSRWQMFWEGCDKLITNSQIPDYYKKMGHSVLDGFRDSGLVVTGFLIGYKSGDDEDE